MGFDGVWERIFSANGKYFADLDMNTVKVYKITVRSHETELSLHMRVSDGRCIRFTHDCSRLVVGHYASTADISVWDLATKEKLLCINPPRGQRSIDITPDDTRIVGLDGRNLICWSLDTGELIDGYGNYSDSHLDYLVLSTDSQFALAKRWDDNKIRALCFEQRSRGIVLQGHRGPPRSLACSDANPHRVISSGSSDMTVKLWTLPTTESLRGDVQGLAPSEELVIDCDATFIGHEDSVSSVVFCPDERWVVSGSADGSVRFWDSTDGTCVLLLYGNVGTVGKEC